jgi:hypothetical protein
MHIVWWWQTEKPVIEINLTFEHYSVPDLLKVGTSSNMSIIVGVFLSLFSLSIYSSIRDAMIGVEFSVNPLCSGFWTDNIFPLILIVWWWQTEKPVIEINLTFEHYSVPDLLKVGTLTPIYKNKGLMTESKNSREITITPPLSKIIETILKFRIKGNPI